VTEKRWKAQERRIARLLNCKRNLNSGEAGPDLENAALAVQVKDRKDLPQWMQTALLQIRSQADKERLGIVVLTTPATSRAMVLMDLDDYRDWHVGIPGREETAYNEQEGANRWGPYVGR